MRMVPRGKLITTSEVRALLAKRHGATINCPLTTGILAWVAAHPSEEAAAEGKPDTTPYWRTLKSGGVLNPKYPGGIAAQIVHLQSEGHTIVPGKGKKPPRVKDFKRAW